MATESDKTKPSQPSGTRNAPPAETPTKPGGPAASSSSSAPAAPAATPDPPPPQYAGAEEFREFQRSVEGGFNRLLGMLSAPRGDASPATAAPIDDVTDEDLENAIAEGRGSAAAIRKALNAQRERIRREEVEPLRNVGLGSIAKLVKHTATQSMPYYERYRSDIDAAIDQLSPEARLDPDVLISIHNTIAGRPENIDRMLKEEREKALRSEGTDPSDTPTGRRGDAGSRGPEVPSPRELLGDDAAAALEAANRTPDRFAQGLGYRDWPEYVKSRQAYLNPETPTEGSA